MSHVFLPASVLAAVLFSANAMAAYGTGAGDAVSPPARGSDLLMLAQYGDLEVYYDGLGNRVIVDSYTGEVIAVEPPDSRPVLRRDRRALRRQSQQERYYNDDPDDMEQFLQRQREEEARVYDPYSGDGYEIFPEPPMRDLREPPENFRQGGESPAIERRPLDEASLEPPSPPPEASAPQLSNPASNPVTPSTRVDSSLALGSREEIANLQVLLDRVGASPGVIDGRFGSNVEKALAVYREITGQTLRSTDAIAITEALANTGGDAFAHYEITNEDAAGPYIASVPADYGDKAQLEHLSYTSVTEALAERFHMDEAFLKALNPQANFNRPGTIIKVANFGRQVATPVARIVADKGSRQVRAYDQTGRLVAAYPATIGSEATPSPSGVHAVTRIAVNPNYTYNPKINFKQGDNDKVLTIPPGPNGPVGSIWIALDKPTYGIHGTPEPSQIGKTSSHGCVRLTNWDASELARLVKPGVTVEFVD
ncbi:L,D-transpeptidase family protein [Aquamicrobium segne]|uniref:L,D-transpeptidase family protein n=1 Tax=Aquamicrobium segne TaxID=469547 RepID=A0ABW0H3I1_9HYPH